MSEVVSAVLDEFDREAAPFEGKIDMTPMSLSPEQMKALEQQRVRIEKVYEAYGPQGDPRSYLASVAMGNF